jgi:hypothetical protein
MEPKFIEDCRLQIEDCIDDWGLRIVLTIGD